MAPDTTMEARPPRSFSRNSIVAYAILVVFAGVFIVLSLPAITAPFGDSDEGINGAVWGFDSRALRELGVLDSHLGGVRVDGTKYATHPPLIVVETAAIERLVGEHPWSTRASAWLASLASILLLFLLLRALSLGPVAAASATVAALGCHMFFVYGSMLDTMIIALPFALATTLVWYRQWTGVASVRSWQLVLLTSITCLAGWQAIFLVGLCGVSLAARQRSEPGSIRRSLPYFAGVAIGVALTLGWAYWVYGSFTVVGEKLGRRTGGTEPVSLADMVSFQLPWLGQLLGVGLLAWIACAVSLRDRRFRPLAALSLASVIVYAVLLREGSGGHQYWNYWGLVPAAVGLAYIFSLIEVALRSRFRKHPSRQWALTVALAAVIVGFNLLQPNQARTLISDGYRPYDLVASLELPAGQTTIPYIAEPYRMDDWLRYRGGPQGEPILDADALRNLAAEHPDAVVVVLGSCASPDPTGICNTLTFGADHDHPDTVAPRTSTAAELVARLDAQS